MSSNINQIYFISAFYAHLRISPVLWAAYAFMTEQEADHA